MTESNVHLLPIPAELPNYKWEVTILVEPRLAFLLAVLRAFVTRKQVRITHRFTSDPRKRIAGSQQV